jgi:CHAT domain-containing protein
VFLPGCPPIRALNGMTGCLGIGLLLSLGSAGRLTSATCVLEPRKPASVSSCSVDVKAGDYIRIIVEANFLKLSAKLVSGDGTAVTQADNLLMVNTLEEDQPLPLTAIAADGGTWRVEVSAATVPSPSKLFRVRLEELRPARPEDSRRISADQAFLAGLKKRMTRNRDGYRAAVSEFKTALAIRDDLGDRAPRGVLLEQLGDMQARLGDLSGSLDFYRQALEAYREAGNTAGQASAAGSIGQVHKIIGNLPEADEFLSQARAEFHKLGMRRHEAGVLEGLASVSDIRGETYKSLEYHTNALQLTREEGDRRVEAVSLGNLASAYLNDGDPEKAIASYREALAIAHEIGDRRNEAQALVNIGEAYRELGVLDKALESYEEARRIQQVTGLSEAESFRGIGQIYQDFGQPRHALDYFGKYLAIHRKANTRLGLVDALNLVGGCWVDLGDPVKALGFHQEAMGLVRGSQSRGALRATLEYIAGALFRSGRLERALEPNSEALELARATQYAAGEESGLFQRAQIRRAQGRLEEARADVESSLRIAESIRGRVAARESRAFYLATVYDRYNLLTDVLMQMGLEREAFETAERARARGLLDVLVESRAAIRQGVDPKLLERERQLSARLEAAASRQVRVLGAEPESAKAKAIELEIRKLSTEEEEVETEIRRTSPRYAALAFPQPLGLDQIRKDVLDPDTVLLEYALGEPRSYVWAITPESLVTAALPGRAEIEAAVRAFYDRVSSRAPVPATEADKLSSMLLGPVAGELTARRIAVVADGALAYLPFAILHSPEAGAGLLVASHEVVMIPSAATVALLRAEVGNRPAAAKRAAVFADPVFSANDPRVGGVLTTAAATRATLERSAHESGFASLDRLPASRREARSILHLARGQQNLEALDFRASRAAALDPELSQYGIVHFATHGLINSRHPELSGLVLSMVDEHGRPQDGFLQAHDIYNMTLRADLVVLSACRTALGNEIRGEGLIGLTRAFMYAGAPRVVASLWRVPDNATAELMTGFYRALLMDNLAPAAALRRAQLELASQPRFRDPYNWAGFVLEGEWR